MTQNILKKSFEHSITTSTGKTINNQLLACSEILLNIIITL